MDRSTQKQDSEESKKQKAPEPVEEPKITFEVTKGVGPGYSAGAFSEQKTFQWPTEADRKKMTLD